MATIRFVAPIEDLRLSAVPAVFSGFVCDIDDTDTLRLTRMRFLGAPYGVQERGPVDQGDAGAEDLTEQTVAAGVLNETSPIGSAVGERIAGATAGLRTQVNLIQEGVEDLLSRPDGSGVIVGVELPAELSAGDVAARLRTY